MKTSIISNVMAGLALLSIFVPSAFAEDYNRNGHYSNNNSRYSHKDSRNRYSNYSKYNKKRSQYNNQYNSSNNVNNKWDWNQHNWNDQRAQLRANWRRNNNMSSVQQQQLDAQMKAQWLQYHNNNWNGTTTWDQYSDPQFLDYVRTSNPSLLTTLRSSLGF